jgi:hypothetical protein
MVFIHATKKLLDRTKQPAQTATDPPTTALGNWYATALLWKPQLALLVNEHTLLPVLMPLTPATSLAARFPSHLAIVLAAHGVDRAFIATELAQMTEVRYAKTANRSVVGVMNQFAFQAEVYRDYLETGDLLMLSLRLAETPCSPLYKRAITPERELKTVVETGHR